MFDLFSPIATFYSFKNTNIDNVVFKLHYQLTSIPLFAFSAWITSRFYFGKPIDCYSPSYSWSSSVANAFCLSNSPFVVYENQFTANKKKEYLTYYQWVGSVLFLQAISFLLPKLFWTQCEKGLIGGFIQGANLPIKTCNDKPKVSYIAKKIFENRNSFNKTYCIYCFAEVLNLVNVIIQFVVTNLFLNKHFFFYGLETVQFLSFDQPTVRHVGQTPNDPRLKLFPYKAKCTLTEFAYSGKPLEIDALCSLILNTLNGNLYLLLWFWYITLIFLSTCAIIYRAATFFWPSIMFIGFNKDSITSAIGQGSVGDWFIMKIISNSLVRNRDFANLVLELQNLNTDDAATNLKNA